MKSQTSGLQMAHSEDSAVDTGSKSAQSPRSPEPLAYPSRRQKISAYRRPGAPMPSEPQALASSQALAGIPDIPQRKTFYPAPHKHAEAPPARQSSRQTHYAQTEESAADRLH